MTDEKTALDGFRCLVVDDDEVIANAVSAMLRKAGAAVQTINSPEAATDICREASIDVVFTDLVMDGTDGLELMEKVRSVDSSVGIVLMTSHAAPEIASNATKHGANGFLRKPFKYEACLQEAVKALNHRREKLGLGAATDV